MKVSTLFGGAAVLLIAALLCSNLALSGYNSYNVSRNSDKIEESIQENERLYTSVVNEQKEAFREVSSDIGKLSNRVDRSSDDIAQANRNLDSMSRVVTEASDRLDKTSAKLDEVASTSDERWEKTVTTLKKHEREIRVEQARKLPKSKDYHNPNVKEDFNKWYESGGGKRQHSLNGLSQTDPEWRKHENCMIKVMTQDYRATVSDAYTFCKE